jgi:hypothetical protein
LHYSLFDQETSTEIYIDLPNKFSAGTGPPEKIVRSWNQCQHENNQQKIFIALDILPLTTHVNHNCYFGYLPLQRLNFQALAAREYVINIDGKNMC